MKNFFLLLSFSVFILSCEKESKKTDLSNSIWVNARYLETLKKTKSPLQAKVYADTVMVSFNAKSDTATMVWNFHEGSPFSVKQGERIQLFNMYTPKPTPEYEGIIDNNTLKLGKTSFQKVDTIGFVEKLLWIGKYTTEGKTIELKSDRKLTGIDSLSTYFVWTDYVTTQTNIDLIDFYDKNNQAKTYGYKFAGNEVIFYEFIWKEEGIIGTAGKELFRWKKG